MFSKQRADREFYPSNVPEGLNVLQDEPFIKAKAEDEIAFLKALSPITGFTAKRAHRTFIYRGQASSAWPLIPASRRRKTGLGSFVTPGMPKDTLQWRLVAEAQALLDFCNLADYQGLRIPNLSTVRDVFRSYFGRLANGDPSAINSWPPDIVTPALALAQHSGLCTCLLDFTRNPFVASYFASRNVFEISESTSGELCVWIAADPTCLNAAGVPCQIRLVIPPASDNLTLQRQEGLFIYAPRKGEIDKWWDEPYVTDEPLEDAISNHSPGSMVQVTLDRKFAKDLLRATIKMGYDSSHLFPTFEGTVRCLEEYKWAGITPTFLWPGI